MGAGTAGRLSGYVHVLTQARKAGKSRITSEQLSAYTRLNASQIRRDLAGLGRLGTRGVGYSVDGLLDEIRQLLVGEGEQPVALVGAGRLGQAIAGSPLFAESGISIAAIFDRDPAKVGRKIGAVTVSDPAQLAEVVRRRKIVAGLLAVPAASAPEAARGLVDAGVSVIVNYSEALLDVPDQIRVVSLNPAAQLLAVLSLRPG
jgi:redox-sensing transcriptional repressor